MLDTVEFKNLRISHFQRRAWLSLLKHKYVEATSGGGVALGVVTELGVKSVASQRCGQTPVWARNR